MDQVISSKTGIIYCRVSSKEQVEGTSLESQEKVCREYAEKQNIQILNIFIEKGESAKTTDRAQFTKAIAMCSHKRPKVDYFIVYKLDRFARNQDDHVIVRQMLSKYGTELKSATEPINSTPVGRAMEGMISVFAEFDNNVRRERCVSGMKERVRQGIWCWPAPFGYYRKERGGNIIPNDKISPYIRLAFEEYARGIHTYDSLAKYLCDLGVRMPSGHRPVKQFVERILKNPIYTGHMEVWGERYKGTFEPIINEALFRKCQGCYRHSQSHRMPRLQKNPYFPLRRLVICSQCHASLTGSISKGGSGNKYAYYHHHHQGCPYAMFLPKQILEDKFAAYLKEMSPKDECEKVFQETVLDFWKGNTNSLSEKQKSLRREISILEQDKLKAFESHRKGIYTDDEFIVQKRILNSQLEQKQSLLESTTIPEIDIKEALETYLYYARNAAEIWKKADYPIKMQFQKLIFAGGKVSFDGEKFGTTKYSLIYGDNWGNPADHGGLPTDVEEQASGTDNMSLVYAINQSFAGNKSVLVDHFRRNWNRWVSEMREWAKFHQFRKECGKSELI